MKRMLASILSLMLVCGLMTGCQSKPAESGESKDNTEPAAAAADEKESGDLPTITFYHHYYQDDAVDAKAMRALFDEFAELHKDEFIFKPVPVEGDPEAVYNKCIQEIASGSFPDIVETGGWNVVPAASEAGLIMDLKPYIDADADFKAGVGVNYDQNLVDGKIYTVREQLETMGFWYNEDLFSKAGADTPDQWQSWDDFVAAFDKLKASPDVKTPVSLNQGWPTNIMFMAHLLGTQEGRDFIDTPLTTFDNDAFKGTVDFVEKHALSQIDTAYFGAADSESYRDDFLNGDAAMLFNGVWEASSFVGDGLKIDPAVVKPAVFPASENGKHAAIMSASCGYVISDKLSNAQKDAAVAFVKYMCSPEVSERIFTEVLAMPAYLGLDYDQYINDESVDPVVRKLAEACKQCAQADYQTCAMSSLWGSDVEMEIGGKYAAMHDGSKTADQIVAELDETLN